ncbi:multidrug resistance efflux pump [Synechococcus sp. PCC 7502]|uniref:HlyD family secretion protein n=1 Tax=Synechococcus sp. PCC 7502 TaxID=1173263 RepID=UPI00029F9DD2|nr:HlyD family secretion protein [Synechococcus sp. PCC 7502]AFY74510.1 multidrug resistance efflux pump [Synechococcus sp. PCC 7502]
MSNINHNNHGLVSSESPSLALTEAPSKPSKEAVHKSHRPLLLWGALGLGGLILSGLGYHWWSYASSHQETDNAYVIGHIQPVSSRIAGTVVKVLVEDNQEVPAGIPLVQLDRQDYEIALQQAQATLKNVQRQADVAKSNIQVAATNALGKNTEATGTIQSAKAEIATATATLTEAKAFLTAGQANLAQVQANLIKAKLDYQRYSQLRQSGAIAQQQLDAAQASYNSLVAQRQSAEAQIQEAQAKVLEARTNLDNAQAKFQSSQGIQQEAESNNQQIETSRQQYQAALAAIAKAEIDVKNAQLQLSYTQIISPNRGRIGNKTVEVGQRVSVSQPLLAIVEEKPWIVANFKETQLEKMRSGQEVEIKIDAFPSHVFKGKVDSFAPASGARFSLLPPDNATGNFTKIVQRVPVKITFEPESIKDYDQRITPGMSASVSVITE